MKFRSMKVWSVALAAMTIGCWAIASDGTEQPAREPNPNDLNLVPTQNVLAQPVYQRRAEAKEKALLSRRPLTSLSGNIRTAAEAVRDAKDDQAKAAAQKNLSDLLGKYFDEDMKRRQGELTQIEERLTKLRELLDRRRTKKQEILELQTRVALNEAEGLGFYDGEQPGGPIGLPTLKIESLQPYSRAGGADSPWYPTPKGDIGAPSTPVAEERLGIETPATR